MQYFWKGIYKVEVLISVILYCMEENVKDRRAILRTVRKDSWLLLAVALTMPYQLHKTE